MKKSNLSEKLSLTPHPANILPVSLGQATVTSHSNGAPVYDQKASAARAWTVRSTVRH